MSPVVYSYAILKRSCDNEEKNKILGLSIRILFVHFKKFHFKNCKVESVQLNLI